VTRAASSSSIASATSAMTRPFRVAFSDDGYALYSYKDNRGLTRTVELSTPGRLQYVPPGGGVRTVGVESIVKRVGGVSYVLHVCAPRRIRGDEPRVSDPELLIRTARLRVDE
jgi:hypothetical protein